jgi:PhoD-like phosphatase
MAKLILGPLLRYVSETEATVWVETDGSCDVSVSSSDGGGFEAREETFEVQEHHYALVCIDGLDPGATYEYEVSIDGERCWPLPDSDFPPSVIRTLHPERPIDMVFGSCRVALPHEPPYNLSKDEDPDGREYDALYAKACQMADTPTEEWPQLMLMLGDQVYVDEGSPKTREYIRSTRGTAEDPGEQVMNFEEYTRLYWETWGDPAIRWLLSTVSTSMVIDDHDMSDDWNISLAWVNEMRSKPWWKERIVGGLSSYWVYQWLGNLSPRDLADNDVYQAIRGEDDASPVLREFAARADQEVESARWSYCRDLGNSRLLVLDSRSGRVLEEGRRSIFDDEEWDWITDHATGDFDHLIIGTSDPYLLAPGLHYVEAWSEAAGHGAWGRLGRRLAESARRTLDLDHWGAFRMSFDRLTNLLEEVGSGKRGDPPASVVVLSGDVHHAYLADIAFRKGRGVKSAVYQATTSPFRNPLNSHERAVIRFGLSQAGTAIGRALARSAGAPDPGIRWRFCEGPFFDNQAATLILDGRSSTMRLEKTIADEATSGREIPKLETVFERPLA